MNEEFIVVITIPHFENDKTSEEMGKRVSKELDKLNIANKVFIGDIKRKYCDLNRYFCTKDSHPPPLKKLRSRQTKFRSSITSFIKKNSSRSKRIFVLDVHSYDTEKNKELCCYILDNSPNAFVSAHCLNYLTRQNVKIKLFTGSSKKINGNDILNKMNELGLENFLIEFNDKLPNVKRKRLSRKVAEWINHYFVNPPIVSPVSGVIKEISNDHIGVYIRGPYDKVQDDHGIYSPSNSEVEISHKHGNFTFPNFISLKNKKGFMSFKYNNNMKFKVYVGKGYVTDNIKLIDPVCMRDCMGKKIGDIVVGENNSYAEIFYVGDKSWLRKGFILTGGKSCLVIGLHNNIETYFNELQIKNTRL